MVEAGVKFDITSKPKSPKNAFEPRAIFNVPEFEMPEAFRSFAEQSLAQTRDNFEKAAARAKEMPPAFEKTCSTAVKGAAEYGIKVIEATCANANAAFDFASKLMTMTSLPEAIELSTSYTREQYEALTAQTKELTALARKVATDTAEPMQKSVATAFERGA
jgi:phasin